MTVEQKVDAVIVGAGAAGSVYAATLAAAGKKVVVLEAGPPWTIADLVSSQIWARRLKWRGASVLATGEHRIGHNAGAGSGFGGAALHHYGTWPRFSEENFEIRSRFGRGLDWPITYGDLRPWYDRVQAEVGIAGDAEAEIWRPAGDPYPMPGIKRFAQGELLARGFAKLGLPTAPLPVIVNSVPYRGRPACIYDGWCDAGCPTGALGNPFFSYFRDAQRAGAEFHADSTITRILTDNRGRARGVEYYRDGEPREQAADVVIVAASTVENIRLLLNSGGSKHSTGLANSSGLVGKYLLAECAVPAWGLFEEETEPYMGINAGQLMYREGYVNKRRPNAFGGYQWQIGNSMKPNDLFGVAMTRPNIFGDALHDFLQTSSHHIGMMIGFGGGIGERENRVELDSSKDHFGFPLARTVHRFPRDIVALSQYMKAQGEAAIAAAGAYEAWSSGQLNTGHVVGGTIMGNDPAASVTDSFGRTHDVSNLVIGGASLFPCSGGAGPAYTIHAVALRSAEHMVAHWSDYTA